MKKLTLALLPLPLVACGVVPGTDCNLMYAPDQVHIDLTDVAWEDGDWRLTIDGDIVCEFTLPLADEGAVECLGGGVEVMVTASPDLAGLDEVTVWEFAPDSFDATLHLDDDLWDEQTFEPEYETDEPNGRGCGERDFASVTW